MIDTPITKRTQGANANRSGGVAEKVVANILDAHRVSYQRQFPIGECTYRGKKVRADFFLPKQFVILETKWQTLSGTADEKLPYLVMNIKQFYPYGTIVVLGGKGWCAGSIEWLREQVDGAVLMDVFSLDDLMEWCRKQW